ncbi:hypothetical protein ACWCQQ_05725 [Streptomyces sp. NPDC002143]
MNVRCASVSPTQLAGTIPVRGITGAAVRSEPSTAGAWVSRISEGFTYDSLRR